MAAVENSLTRVMRYFQHWFMKDAYIRSMMEEKDRYSRGPYWRRTIRRGDEKEEA